MTRHYHVGENTPGYLPESDPTTYDDLGEAIDGANFVVTELEGMGYSTGRSGLAVGARFEGTGFLLGDDAANITLTHDDSDLGRVVFVHSCDDDCETES